MKKIIKYNQNIVLRVLLFWLLVLFSKYLKSINKVAANIRVLSSLLAVNGKINAKLSASDIKLVKPFPLFSSIPHSLPF